MKILVVDDDEDGREMVAELLQAQGATVVTSTERGRGAARCRGVPARTSCSPTSPCPGSTATSCSCGCATPCRRGSCPQSIALTAYARAEDKARALAHGYAAHVAKPVDALLLVRTIRQLLPTAA